MKMEVQNIEVQNVIQKPVLMFRGREIQSGKRISPLKGIIYGDNGAGKTETLSNAKLPIIMDMEGNCGHIEVPKEPIENFYVFHEFLDFLINENHEYKTLIGDSLDSIEILISENIANTHDKKDLSYGKSSAIWQKYIKDIITKMDILRNKKGMNILFTAHLKVKTVNNPMTEQYDRYDLKINEAMRTGFCNWVQFICMLHKEVILEEKKDSGFGKKKAKDIVRRVLYTNGDPTYYGKNVFNLPSKILMESATQGWEQITKNVNNFYGK